jgi:Mn2+/Fe2+ NRAMP family transporter
MLRLIAIVYLVIGVLVAAARDYFERLDSVQGIVSLIIAIVLWPIVVFDVDVRIGKDKDGGGGDFLLPLGVMWSIVTARGARLLEEMGQGRH